MYNVTVQATDDRRNTASQKVTVTVTNIEEQGAVRLSTLAAGGRGEYYS